MTNRKEKLKIGQTIYIETNNAFYRDDPDKRTFKPYRIYEADDPFAYTKDRKFRLIQSTWESNQGEVFVSKRDIKKHIALEKELKAENDPLTFDQRLKLQKYAHTLRME